MTKPKRAKRTPTVKLLYRHAALVGEFREVRAGLQALTEQIKRHGDWSRQAEQQMEAAKTILERRYGKTALHVVTARLDSIETRVAHLTDVVLQRRARRKGGEAA